VRRHHVTATADGPRASHERPSRHLLRGWWPRLP
jgi:hypothetical protein